MSDEMGVTIKLIANSHAHLDHILGVRGIQAKTGARFLLHRDDLELSRAAVEHAKRFGLEADPVPEPADQLLFSGDTLFRGSIGRTDMPGGSYEQEMSSIVDRLLTLPDETTVLPGHMQETTIAFERQANPFIRQELIQRAGAGRQRPSGLVIPE